MVPTRDISLNSTVRIQLPESDRCKFQHVLTLDFIIKPTSKQDPETPSLSGWSAFSSAGRSTTFRIKRFLAYWVTSKEITEGYTPNCQMISWKVLSERDEMGNVSTVQRVLFSQNWETFSFGAAFANETKKQTALWLFPVIRPGYDCTVR